LTEDADQQPFRTEVLDHGSPPGSHSLGGTTPCALALLTAWC
jgi:hypothetical protein